MTPHDLASLLAVPDLSSRLTAVQRNISATIEPYRGALPAGTFELLTAPGKRLRAALTIALAQLGSPNLDAVMRAATAVELVQIGSLIHDDVIDRSPVRRGKPTVHRVAGDGPAVVIGDLVLALAGDLVAPLGPFPASLLAGGMTQMAKGELVELLDLGNADRSLDRYLMAIQGKTGALFAAACRLGAWCGALPLTAQNAATTYGDAVGIAYQLVDDLIDVTGVGEVGKPLGTDLASGVYTAPVILALQRRGKGRLRRTLFGGHPADLDEALAIVRGSPALREVVVRAAASIRVAEAAARELGPKATTIGLQAFPRALAISTLQRAGVEPTLVSPLEVDEDDFRTDERPTP